MTRPATMESDERVVAVREITDDSEITFYAVRDVGLGYWRSREPLDDYEAWTRDRHARAEFDTRQQAEAELQYILAWREERAC